MFIELWQHMQPTIESSYRFKYEDILVTAIKELDFKTNTEDL